MRKFPFFELYMHFYIRKNFEIFNITVHSLIPELEINLTRQQEFERINALHLHTGDTIPKISNAALIIIAKELANITKRN